MVNITKAQALEYVRGYWSQIEDVERFEVKHVSNSADLEAFDVTVYVEWKDGNVDWAIPMTCWLEDGRPYGEW